MTSPALQHISALIRLIRPKQWLKNSFVFAPLVFSKELFTGAFFDALMAFLSFSLTASAVYIVNDIADVEADRLHPEKRNRPLAARTVSVTAALGLMTLLLAIVLILVWQMDSRFIAILVIYFLLNLAYSYKLKEVVLLDVFIIAAGFMLRILGGAYAIDVRVSTWIVLCSLFISLFLGFAKRRAELVQLQGASQERKVLSLYKIDFIDQMLTISAAGAVISYALYTVAPHTIEMFGTDRMIYTTVFVIYGVFRYLYIIHTSSASENPTNAVTSDFTILWTGVLWILACIFLIYGGQYLNWPWK
jgi:4-hydroxybenzoate polyprenyltransferase